MSVVLVNANGSALTLDEYGFGLEAQFLLFA